jgi:hypothetical protein
MKKGLLIALIVGGVLLAAGGAFFTVSVVSRNVFHGGQNLLGTRERVWNDPTGRNFSGMPHGMLRGAGRGYAFDEAFYLQRWAYMLGIPLDELQARLDAGESLDEIAESLGVDMPCDELFEGSDADLNATGSTGWDWNGYGAAGMCF